MAHDGRDADERAQDAQKARYEFKRALEELAEVKGRGTELISVYIPPDKQISDVAGHLREELGESQNIKSKQTRDHVGSALESILSRLKRVQEVPETGLVFFVGHKSVGGGRTDMVQEVVVPPEPVPTYLYRCDSAFHLDPLRDMLKDQETWGLIVIDRSEATYGFLRGKRIDVVANLQSMVPSKHGRGGQSQRRFERLIEEAAHEYFKKVGDKVNEAFLAEEELRGILVGGPGATKDFFVDKDYLHHELKQKVVTTIDTGYTDPSGLREMVDRAADTMEQLELNREKTIMKRFLGEIPKDQSLATYGEQDVRRAMTMGAVDTLLLSEGLRRERLEVTCDEGHAVEVTVDDGAVPETCPTCGADVEVTARTDVVAELAEEAENFGSGVEMISTDSEEGALLMNAFGGVAAILRFQTGQ